MYTGDSPLNLLLTTEDRPTVTHAKVDEVAASMGLDVHIERYRHHASYTRIAIGSVLVTAFTLPLWRDLGEGPSWREQFTLPMDVRVPLLWEPFSTHPVRITFPVTSLLRQGGAKWGGVSVVANDDTTPKASTHTMSTYDYAGFKELGTTRALFGYAARLEPGVSFREAPYTHGPSRTHWVMDLSSTRR